MPGYYVPFRKPEPESKVVNFFGDLMAYAFLALLFAILFVSLSLCCRHAHKSAPKPSPKVEIVQLQVHIEYGSRTANS